MNREIFMKSYTVATLGFCLIVFASCGKKNAPPAVDTSEAPQAPSSSTKGNPVVVALGAECAGSDGTPAGCVQQEETTQALISTFPMNAKK